MTDKPFPVPNSTKPFWRNSLHFLDSHRTTEDLPSETNIVIIGAGYAGASIAHHLLENCNFQIQQCPVVVLEAREACSGATGRNGGHVKPDPYTRPAQALESHGKEAAEEVASFEARHLKAIADLVKRESVDCDYVLTRSTDVCLYDAGRDDLKAKLDKLSEAGISTVDDVFYSGEKTAESISGVKGAKGCFSSTAGHIWPYKFVLHLLSKAISSGINLQTHTPVTSVSSQADSDGQWTVNTPRGSIKAKKVIYASNAYTSGLLPGLEDKIVPVRGICSRIITPKAHPPLLSNSYVLRFNDWEYDYLIPRHDGSIVVGGARRDYYTNLGEWFNVFDDSTLIEPAKEYFDGYMQRHFRGWEDSEAVTDEIWTGVMGYTSDGFPFVGDVPGKPGQYVCAGFSGHGMPQVFLSAKSIASMVVDEKSVGETDLPKPYHSTQERFDSKSQHISLAAFDTVLTKLGMKN